MSNAKIFLPLPFSLVVTINMLEIENKLLFEMPKLDSENVQEFLKYSSKTNDFSKVEENTSKTERSINAFQK